MKPGRWSTRRIALALYPLAAGAMAVNLFFASLIGSWMGWPVLDPWSSALGGLALGVPLTLAFARHFRTLMDDADPKRG